MPQVSDVGPYSVPQVCRGQVADEKGKQQKATLVVSNKAPSAAATRRQRIALPNTRAGATSGELGVNGRNVRCDADDKECVEYVAAEVVPEPTKIPPRICAMMVVANSGTDVPSATMVAPMMKGAIPTRTPQWSLRFRQ